MAATFVLRDQGAATESAPTVMSSSFRRIKVALLTEEEFSRHVNTKFRVNVDGPDPIDPIDLELIEVKGYQFKDQPTEENNMERFSVHFYGPGNVYLPQATYNLTHDSMGEIALFLVPLAHNERGFLYEAVFNYFIKK